MPKNDDAIALPLPSILAQADQLINGDRNEAYGPPEVVFERYAVGWTQIIGAPVTGKQVALCMAWLKIMRETNRAKRDNLTDAAGYIGLADKIVEANRIEH